MYIGENEAAISFVCALSLTFFWNLPVHQSPVMPCQMICFVLLPSNLYESFAVFVYFDNCGCKGNTRPGEMLLGQLGAWSETEHSCYYFSFLILPKHFVLVKQQRILSCEAHFLNHNSTKMEPMTGGDKKLL